MKKWLLGLLLATTAWGQSSYQIAEQRWQRLVDSGKVKLSRHAASVSRVDRLGQKVALASRRTVPWHFFVVATKDINAFTVGEGFVAVTEGLLGLGLTDDELAGVLAHEVAHGTEQHLMRDIFNQQQLDQARKEYAEAQKLAERYAREYQADGNDYSYESKMTTVKRRLSAVEKRLQYLQGQARFDKELNHEQEIAADGVGLRYAVTAGYDPEGLVKALTKIQAYGVQRFGESYTGEGETHPPTARRLEVLSRVYSSWRTQGWGR